MKTCPTCRSPQIERCHRFPYERFLSLLGIYPFICNECGRRFHSLAPKRPQAINIPEPPLHR